MNVVAPPVHHGPVPRRGDFVGGGHRPQVVVAAAAAAVGSVGGIGGIVGGGGVGSVPVILFAGAHRKRKRSPVGGVLLLLVLLPVAFGSGVKTGHVAGTV